MTSDFLALDPGIDRKSNKHDPFDFEDPLGTEPFLDPGVASRHDPLPDTPFDGPLVERDQELLLLLGRHRVLSFRQLRAALFASCDPSVLSRRLAILEKQKWLQRWMEPVVRGGHPGYAYLTKQGWQWARERLSREVRSTPWERLVGFMLPHSNQATFRFEPGLRPRFLAHQRECNELVLAYQFRSHLAVRWASTWDKPFPYEVAGGFPLPQPDFVLVLEIDGHPELIFGEYDRGFEAPSRFRTAKVEKYANLSQLPEFCDTFFGFRTFTVWVAVTDAVNFAPGLRLETLQRVAVEGGACEGMRFALAGEVFSNPEMGIWQAPLPPVPATIPTPTAESQPLPTVETPEGSDALREEHGADEVDEGDLENDSRSDEAPEIENDGSTNSGR